MNLYLITREDKCGYDEYDSFVIAAENAEIAKNYHPDKGGYGRRPEQYSSWCASPDMVEVILIGQAEPHVEAGLVISSFNAG